MVVMDAIVPQPETKVKGHSQDRVSKNSQPDKMTFAHVIGNVAKQTQRKADEEKPITVPDEIKSNRSIDDIKDAKMSQTKETSQTQETTKTQEKPQTLEIQEIQETSETDETAETATVPEVSFPAIPFNRYETMFADFKMFLTAQIEQGSQDLAALNKNGNEANSGLDKLMNSFRFADGSMKQEYAQTWRMNAGQMDSMAEEFSTHMKMPVPGTMDNKVDLANAMVLDETDDLAKPQVLDKTVLDKTFDNVSKLLRDLGGQVKETSQRPVIALTERVVTNTPPQSQDDPSFMNMMTPKQMESIPVGLQNTSPLTSTTTLAPQVIQAIQQAAMHLQPRQVQEMTISLHPQELGKLDIAMRMENGQLHVTIKATEMATGQFLQNQMQDLKQNLSDAGIDCGNLQMDFGDQAESQSFEEAFQDGRQRFMDDNDDNQTPINNFETMAQEEITQAYSLLGLKRVNIRA